VAQT